jgi:hypothetical protein
MKLFRVIISVLILTAFTATFAQQPAAPSHKPVAKAPPLTVTMQLIQKELNAVGKLSFVVHIYDQEEGNGISKYIEERSNVVADPATCTIRFHWSKSVHGDVVDDEDVSFSLRDVLAISMMNIEQVEKKQYEEEKAYPEEKQTLHMKFDPQMYVVIMRKPDDNTEGFSFVDQKQATRVAKAMGHAIELCGGKNVPF